MSNFKLGYPSLQPYATSSANLAALSSRPLTNLFSGSRADRFELASSSATTLLIAYDLGGGVSKSINFVAIMRAKLLHRDNCAAVKVYGSASNSLPGSPLFSVTSLSTQPLMGPNSEDYFSIFAETAAYRYWWLELTSNGTASKYSCAKILFGKALDFGREPSAPTQLNLTRNAPHSREAAHTINIKLEAVSDTNKETLLNQIAKYSDVFPVIPLDPSQLFLKNTKGFHAYISDYAIETPNVSENNITLNLQEQI